MKRHEATFSKYEKAAQWLLHYDAFSSALYTGEFSLVQYVPYTLVPFYPLFQERGGPKIERSQEDWDVSGKT